MSLLDSLLVGVPAAFAELAEDFREAVVVVVYDVPCNVANYLSRADSPNDNDSECSRSLSAPASSGSVLQIGFGTGLRTGLSALCNDKSRSWCGPSLSIAAALFGGAHFDPGGAVDVQMSMSLPVPAQQEEVPPDNEGRPSLSQLFGIPGYFSGSCVMWLSALEALSYGVLVVVCGSTMPSPCCLYSFGASWGPTIASGSLWRLVAPIFLHASFSHLVMNMIFQLRFGFQVESYLGPKRFMMMYLGSGIFGNLVSAGMDPMKLALGASTSGMGVLGAQLGMLLIDLDNYPPAVRKRMLLWIFFVVMISSSAGSDVMGHAGGFLGGLLLTTALSPSRNMANRQLHRAAAVAAVALISCEAAGHLADLPAETTMLFSEGCAAMS